MKKVSQLTPDGFLDPALVGFGVAAARLVDRHRAGRLEASGQFRQLLSAFDLNAEMVDAGGPPDRRSRN
jgi:hypothetical protein